MGAAFIRGSLIAGLGLGLTACQLFHGKSREGDAPLPAVAVPPDNWRIKATSDDRDRIRDAREAWKTALARVRAAGHAGDLAGLGGFVDPDLALADGAPPPGLYYCRTFKLGAKSDAMLNYVAYPRFKCSITSESGGRLALIKLEGSQRHKGMLWPDGPRRMVFLGTMELGDERAPLAYGADKERNLAGILERIEPNRWRLALPWPHWESNLDLIELVPVQ